MSEIKIENKIVMKKVNEIKPYIRNPRKNDRTVELLCKIIPKVGFNVPLVIDKNGIIVKGHARFAAAIRLGMTELPCIVTHADEDAIKADRITDNKISEFSEWVNEELMHELDMIDFDFDFGELGFPTVNFDDIPSFDYNDEPKELSDEERKKLYEQFLAEQEAENAKQAEIVTQRQIDNAKEAQRETAQTSVRYYKCVCEKCGHVMYVREGDLTERPEV